MKLKLIKRLIKIGFSFFVVCVIVLLGFYFLLPCFGFNLVEVQTNSMLPEFGADDCLIIKKSKEFGVGQVICFKDEVLGLKTHRVVGIKESEQGKIFLCCGDANLVERGYSWQELSLKLKNCDSDESWDLIDDVVEEREIEGVVVTKFDGFGGVIKTLKVVAIFGVCGLIILLLLKNKIDKSLKNK